jgi:putative aldouronate transport system substrate-binding protein
MKKFLLLLGALILVFAVSACNRGSGDGEGTPGESGQNIEALLTQHNLEAVEIDGVQTYRFTETQTLRVGTWNRPASERNPSIANSQWADWIRAEVLRVHNIAVEFVEIPRWEPDEAETMAALLAANTAPDVSYTFVMSNVETFAEMGGIIDLMPIVDE